MFQFRTQSLAGTVALILLGLAYSGAARADNMVNITIGQAVTNPGDTVEIPVDIASNGLEPAAMFLYISYPSDSLTPNMDFYEFVLTDLNGDPILDDGGNAIVSKSAVRPDAALEGLQKQLSTALHETGEGEDTLAIGIVGVNTATVPDGALLTIAFNVNPLAQQMDSYPVVGRDADNPVRLDGLVFYSSNATSAVADPLPLGTQDGQVLVGCDPAGTPASVAATQGEVDSVVVTWNAVSDVNAQYRVYRSETSNLAQAVPLGEGWQVETSFADVTADSPIVVNPAGCNTPAEVTEVNYYYWVKARTEVGCEGSFSNPSAMGYRGAAKSLLAPAALGGPAGLGNLLALTLAFAGLHLGSRRPRVRG